jgi:Carboxypeptidase regulatory-like domain/TonB-dependent Receptor Plug Domain/TonB dependent receptor
MIDLSAARGAGGIVAAALLLAFTGAGAQGVSTSGIRGEVRGQDGGRIDAHVRITHDATGHAVEVHAPTGRFLVQGLEPGGPYTVTARAIGFAPGRETRLHLALGELRSIDFTLQPSAAQLDTVRVAAERGGGRPDGGTGTTIEEWALDRLPTLNRDVYDFLRLVPQLSTKISLANPGLSAGGMGFRFNNFLINGVSERTLGGGVTSAFAGSRSIPLDAVREFEVLLAPYDVRYGDFAGALVNTVTRSGTNAFHGSIFAYGRNDRLGRGADTSRIPYERAQYGGSVGGPIVRDRLHFYLATELQRQSSPPIGPYVGQPLAADRVVPVSAADLERFDTIMRSYGLSAGSGGAIENRSPLRNVFARVDLALPGWNSRLVGWSNHGVSNDVTFSRAPIDTFALSSTRVTRTGKAHTSALHVHTALRRAGGGHNELLLSRRTEGLDAIGDADQTIVRVSVPTVSGGLVTLNSGTPENAQNRLNASSFTLGDNLTLPVGRSHVLTLGASIERFLTRREGVNGSYGAWSFTGLDALERGLASRYDVTVDFGSAETPLRGRQWSAYAGDRWQVTDRLSVIGGVRADLLAIETHAPYHPAVDVIFGRRTDLMPRRRPELSPRLGFVWEPSGPRRQRLRGGLGMFAGRYPLAWAHTALTSYGVGGVLRCSVQGASAQYPPAFTPDYRASPMACAGGVRVTPADSGDVNLVDRDLRMVRVARGSLAYERSLPWDLRLTGEALVSRALSDVVFMNLNLAPPEATDPYGRVMYGTIGGNGAATPTRRSGFAEVIEARSTSGGHTYQLSALVETTRDARLRGSMSYTFSRARDVQTPLRVNARGTAAWASARVMSGRHDDLTASISSNDLPHRLIAAGSYVAPWRRAPTTLSFYYVGESGRPFTYLAYGARARGDLNADGSSANDPVYVPRDANDGSEMLVSGLSDSSGADNSLAAQAERERVQRAALGAFIEITPCLRAQRGRILERNSCREPWSNTTHASLRQVVPLGRRSIEVQLEIFNLLNLIEADWGNRREAVPTLLEHVGQTTTSAALARPIFRFAGKGPGWTTASESAFQLQLAARYRF